jgi:threonine-phosphate decarboxylase
MKTAGKSMIFSPLPLSPSYHALFSRNLTGIDDAIVKDHAFCYRPEVLFDAVNKHADGIVIIPSPHDVVGSSLNMDQLLRIVSESERSGTYVLFDESYREFTQMKSPVREVIHSDRTLIVRTFSSYYALPGLSLAYCIGSSEIIQRMREHLPAIDINLLATKAAIAALKDKAYANRTSEFIQKEKEYMINRLKPLNIEFFDTECPFIVLGFESNPEEMRQIFSRYNILIEEPFVHEKHFYLRVPIKQHRMNAAFVKTLRNALKTLNRLQ